MDLAEIREKMEKALAVLADELANVQAGRATGKSQALDG